MEKTETCKCHNHIVFVANVNNDLGTDWATWLCNIFYTTLGCSVDIVNGGKITTAAVSFRNGKNNVLNITDGTFEFIDDADYAAIKDTYVECDYGFVKDILFLGFL